MSSPIDEPLLGAFAVLHTHFTENGEIDRRSLRPEVKAFETGADGVALGTVSEILRLGFLAERNSRPMSR